MKKIFVICIFIIAIALIYAYFFKSSENGEFSVKTVIYYTGSSFGVSFNSASQLKQKIRFLKNNYKKDYCLFLDSGSLFNYKLRETSSGSHLEHYKFIADTYNYLDYDVICPSYRDLSDSFALAALRKINAVKIATNIRFAGSTELPEQFVKARIFIKNNIRFLTLGVISEPAAVSDTKNIYDCSIIVDSPVSAINREIINNDGCYDFIIVSGNMSFDIVKNICISVPQIDLFIWSDEFQELHSEKRIWNDIPIVNAGILESFIGVAELNFNKYYARKFKLKNNLVKL